MTEMIDISEEMAAQEHLRTQERLLRELTASLPVGVAQLDADGLVVHHNRRFLDILGLPALEHVGQVLDPVMDADRDALQHALDAPQFGHDRQVEVAIRRGDDTAHCQVIVRALEDAGGAIVCVNDVTDSVRLRDELEYRATHDPLTGCLNRAAILAHLDRALNPPAQAEPAVLEAGVAVVFIDLDGFKAVNDEHGHGAGDTLLVAVGNCLQAALRETDVVGRFGGDEFLAVAGEVASLDDAHLLGQRIRDTLTTRFAPTGTHAVASIGVAWSPRNRSTTADALINLADAAMYRSKAAGRGEPVVDQAPLDDAA